MHKDFPFDSRSFGFTLDFSTELPLDAVRLTNRISGFYIPCEKDFVTWESLRKLKFRFHLQRNRLTQLFAVVFVIIAAIFAFLIIFGIKDTQNLAVAVASYFLSLWSLERILQDEMNIFPTVFDAMIMLLSIFMPFGLIGRFAGRRIVQNIENRSRKKSARELDSPPYK
jgi:hypothetical protein